MEELIIRSGSKCELCGSNEKLSEYLVSPSTEKIARNCAYTCENCKAQIEDKDKIEVNHWRCLNDSMWNENPAVQVVVYRMLYHLKNEGWPQDLMDMMYLDAATLSWAKEGIVDENSIVHKDSNGAILDNGDSVVLTQTLDVKGSSLSAKRGTVVKKIRLVQDNAEHIEGKVEGQQIVILTKFVKKQ